MDASQDGASATAAPSGSATGLQAPTTPVRARFVVPFAIAYFGLWMTLLTPTIIALSVHLATVLPEGSGEVHLAPTVLSGPGFGAGAQSRARVGRAVPSGAGPGWQCGHQ